MLRDYFFLIVFLWSMDMILYFQNKFIISGIQKNAMNIGENPLWSLGRHDYFLSYLYSRNFFIDNTNYSGPTVDIAKEDLNKILKEFKDVYRSKRAIL